MSTLFAEHPGTCRCVRCGCTDATSDVSVTLCTACAMGVCVPPGEPLRGKTGLDLKREGQERALAAAAPWADRAMAEIERLARIGMEFTSEHVTTAVGLPTGATRMNKNNSVGSLMTRAARRGIIVKTGEYRPSQRRRSHGALLAVWRGR